LDVLVTFQLSGYPDDWKEYQRIWEAAAAKLEEESGGTVEDGGTHELDTAENTHTNQEQP